MTHTSRMSRATRRPWLPLAIAAAVWLLAPAAFAQHAAPAQPAGEVHAPAETGHQPAVDAHDAAPAATAAPAGQAHEDPAHAAAAGDHGASAEHEGGHGESTLAFLSRIANFAILAGGLVYLLRAPLSNYLGARAEQIRMDLVNAAETRRAASEELARIEDRMKELPAELEALKTRGLAEVQAEQVRIRETAAAERERLLEQARREIDQQVLAARRALKQDAADLVVGIARRRVEQEITDADRSRLVDRYVAQVKTAHD